MIVKIFKITLYALADMISSYDFGDIYIHRTFAYYVRLCSEAVYPGNRENGNHRRVDLMSQIDIATNETRILSTVWMNPEISRIGLAREIGLHKSTVTKIVNSLIDEKLLILSIILENPGTVDTSCILVRSIERYLVLDKQKEQQRGSNSR